MFAALSCSVRFGLAWLWSLAIAFAGCALCLLLGRDRAWVLVRTPWARVSLWLLRVRLKVTGLEHARPGFLFISNHASLIDIVVLPALLPRETKFVAKRSLLWVPIWGWFFGACGALLINRQNPAQAMRRLFEGARRLPENWSIVIFPEGRRSLSGELSRFKRGVCSLAESLGGRPIVPIGLDGARDIVPANGWLIRPGEIRVAFGPPIETTGFRAADYHENIAVCREAVLAQMSRAQRLSGDPV